MSREWRLVAVNRGGFRKSWVKRDEAHALKGLEDFRRDVARSPFWSGARVWVECRVVSGWEKHDDG